MKLSKILIAATLLFSEFASADALYISTANPSNPNSENFLWAPINARYSAQSQPNDYFQAFSFLASNGTPSLSFYATAGSTHFTCYLTPSDTLFEKAYDIALSIDESSVLEIFANPSTNKCTKVILQKRTDALNNSLTKTGSSLASPYTTYITPTSFAASVADGGVIAMTDWSGNIKFQANGNGQTVSCTIAPSQAIYDRALRIKNALRNGYWIYPQMTTAAPTTCNEMYFTFSTSVMK